MDSTRIRFKRWRYTIDLWIWTKGKHSRPLKTIRFELDHFPSEEECDRYLSRDKDVRFYMDRGVEISYNNLREYQL